MTMRAQCWWLMFFDWWPNLSVNWWIVISYYFHSVSKLASLKSKEFSLQVFQRLENFELCPKTLTYLSDWHLIFDILNVKYNYDNLLSAAMTYGNLTFHNQISLMSNLIWNSVNTDECGYLLPSTTLIFIDLRCFLWCSDYTWASNYSNRQSSYRRHVQWILQS